MTRFWHEAVAGLGDLLPGGVPTLGKGLLVLTALVALLWYWWPDWLPEGRRGRSRGRKRRRRGRPAPDHADLPPDQLPELPAAGLARSADELAAQGRYREAVRERLRAIVRDLVEREVIAHRPGWTVTELARAAGQARPAIAAPLAAASEIFSGIWYGQRPAAASHDAAMRDQAARVHAALEQRVGV